MHSLIYHNNQIIDVKESRIPPTSAGLIYGWGVFTNLRIYGGEAFAFDRHWNRLVAHAEKARVPVALDLKNARMALDKLITANSVKQGRARITLLKGETGSWRSESGVDSELLMFTSEEASSARDDLTLTLSPYRLLSTALLAGIKQTAMLENLFALEEARSRNFNEAVLLNERGEIVSATAANIFWVIGDEVFTPSISTGCVSGITRHFIHEIAVRWKLHLVEGSFPVQRLLEAREVFLTSTARGVSIVSSFDAKQYSNRQAKISKLISREFQKLTRDAKIET
ncbi:MAG TPA: aminotransferase class IV [Blastocatellia bacterium]|nr:aminotransferase class IV [Blastocatellia bacterium]